MGKVRQLWEDKVDKVEEDFMSGAIPEAKMKYEIRQLFYDCAEEMIEALIGLKYCKDNPSL